MGPLGVNGGSGDGSSGGGGVSDISFDEINDSLDELDECYFGDHFFDIPSYLQDVSLNDEIVRW